MNKLRTWFMFFVLFVRCWSDADIKLEECPYVDKPLKHDYRCHNPINMLDEVDKGDHLRIDCSCPKGSTCSALGGPALTKIYKCLTCIPETLLTSGLYLGDADSEENGQKQTKCEDL